MNNLYATIIVTIFLILGTILSYIPQYYKIIKNKNSNGISNSMLYFGCISCILNLIGVYSDSFNCPNNDNCIINILAILQITIPWLCLNINYIIYLFYTYPNKKKILSTYKYYIISLILINLITIIIIFINKIYNFKNEIFNGVFNVLAGIFSALMFIPQIYTTYMNKNIYSLSIIMLIFHCAGCLLTSIYLIFLTNSYFLVSISFIIGAILEFILVVLCIHYYFKNKKKKNETINNDYLLEDDSISI